MKSKWKITSQYISGEKKYAVYRLIDINKTDHSGNREFAGRYTSQREAAELAAEALNKADK